MLKRDDGADQLAEAQGEADAIRAERDELQKIAEELKSIATEREEDLARAKERMEVAMNDLEKKLETEVRSRYVRVIVAAMQMTDRSSTETISKILPRNSSVRHDKRRSSSPRWHAPRPNTRT